MQLNNVPYVFLDHVCALVFLNEVFGKWKVLETECKEELQLGKEERGKRNLLFIADFNATIFIFTLTNSH